MMMMMMVIRMIEIMIMNIAVHGVMLKDNLPQAFMQIE